MAMIKPIGYGLSVPVAAFLLAAQLAQAQQLDAADQAILDDFNALMAESRGVSKWRDRITLGFFDNPESSMLAHTRAFAAEVEQLTGLQIAIVPPWDLPDEADDDPSGIDGHVVIMLPPDDTTFQDLAFDLGFADDDDTACIEVTETTNDVAVSAMIAIPTDLSEREQRDCLSHEFMHVLGFQGHLDDPASILYPFVDGGGFSDHDRALLALLYDPRITSGMPLDQAARTAHEILLGR